MSTSPGEQKSTRHFWNASKLEIEALADELVALVEEFEGRICEGHVPPDFAERLAQLRQTAERLIRP